MAVDLTNKIHGDFSTGSGVWMGYRGDITGEYITGEGTGANYVIYSNKLIREYNEKISELNQPSDLYIEPYDAGFRYVNDPLLGTYNGAAGAYSTRTVGFGGPLMKIRRNSDNTEVDVRGDANGNISLSSPIIDYRENLALYSEDFSNAWWQKQNCTQSAGAGTDPLGGNTATKIIPASSTNNVGLVRNFGTTLDNIVYNWSAYVKKGLSDWAYFTKGAASSWGSVWFNLTTGEVGVINTGWTNVTMTSVGNDWYRISATVTMSGSADYLYILQSDSNGAITVTKDGDKGMLVWGAQLNKGSTLEKYIKTDGSAITELDRPQESLGEYIGGATGYCSVWYDQSHTGSAQNNLTQTTAADQPIVLAGSTLVTDTSGNAALDFNGSTHHMTLDTGLSSTINISGLSSYNVFQADTTGGTQMIAALGSNADSDKRWYCPLIEAGEFRYSYGTNNPISEASGTANTNLNLATLVADQTQGSAKAFQNGSQIGGTATLDNQGGGTTLIGVGAMADNYHFNGCIGEFIWYTGQSVSVNREQIESNINKHFKIY